MKNPLSIKSCFNKAAISYDNNCFIQQYCGNKLINITKSYLPSANNIIDLGCGSGIVTSELINHYSDYVNLYGIDIADQLLKQAQQKLTQENIIVIQANYENFTTEACLFDLAFANLSLQWSNQIQRTFGNIYSLLNNDGMVAFTLPLQGTFKEFYSSTISFHDSSDIIKSLIQSNFKIIHHEYEASILSFPSLIDASKSVKAVGANYHTNKNSRLFRELLRSRHQRNCLQNLTYNIGYFIAQKND